MFYAVENPELMQAIKDKNQSRAKLELSVLAGSYLEMQEDSLQSQSQPTTNNQLPTTDNPQQKTNSQNEN